MAKIGLSLESQYSLPYETVLPLLKTFGFSAVSPVWSSELNLSSLVDCAHAHGLTVQSVHAPLKNNPLLWEPTTAPSLEVQNRILLCMEDCAKFHVPVMVMHGWQGHFYTFPREPLDFRFFDAMVNYGQKHKVAIAFENLEGEEYLSALLQRYRHQSHIGFCWDSGHDHCYPHKLDFLKEFGDRLMMTHLHDNHGLRDENGTPSGLDDLHLMPGDGDIDWAKAVGRLKTAKKQEILNFELKIRARSENPDDRPYANISTEEFFKAAGQRAAHIAALYDDAGNTKMRCMKTR